MAPRPGLEPGTYGLTGGRSDRAAGRANAHFQESGLPILSSRSLRFPPGESAGSTTGYWKAFRLECLVARLCCFWISAWPQGAGHALASRRRSLAPIPPEFLGAGWRVAERASSKVASDYYRFQRLTGCRGEEIHGHKLHEYPPIRATSTIEREGCCRVTRRTRAITSCCFPGRRLHCETELRWSEGHRDICVVVNSRTTGAGVPGFELKPKDKGGTGSHGAAAGVARIMAPTTRPMKGCGVLPSQPSSP